MSISSELFYMDEINISASQKGESKNGQLTCPPIIGP